MVRRADAAGSHFAIVSLRCIRPRGEVMTEASLNASVSLHRRRMPLLAMIGACLLAGTAVTAVAQTQAKCVTVQEVRSKGGWDIVTQVPNFEPYWFADANGKFQ